MTQDGSSWSEALHGALEIGAAMATPFRRPGRLRWGATEDELARSYPGDELVPEPKWSAMHAVSIQATPERIWPWIAQIGQGRGGFYAYQKLENIVGSQITNSRRILDEHQQICQGDEVRLHVDTPPMTVAVADEPMSLVLFGNPAEGGEGMDVSSSWALLLLEDGHGATRFVSRTRYYYGDDRRSKLAGGPLLLEPVSFVMERKMLKVVKAFAESTM